VSARRTYRGATLALNLALVVLGVVALVRTAAGAGLAPAVGYLLGVGLVVAGGLRLWLLRRTG